jgi:hypothetical protein
VPHPLADTPLQPGDIVGGRYRVIQTVGEGPLDRLYEAQDVDLHERVVIRVQRRSMPADAEHIRLFEDQARGLRGSGPSPSVRLLELSRDDDWGHFAALSNRDNRPLPELLALMDGVDSHGDPIETGEPIETGAPTEPPSVPVDDYRFPSSQSQVELETLKPPAGPAARNQTQPRFAQPRHPKKLKTLELDAPRNTRTTGPRPATLMKKSGDWYPLIRRVGLAVLLLGGVGTGVALYLTQDTREGTAKTEDREDAAAMTATPPRQEVQIVFQVTPSRARLKIAGKLALGHSILVPKSEAPLLIRVEARGYQSRNLKVVPNRDRTVLVALNRSP